MRNFIPLLIKNLDRLVILGLMSASLMLAVSFSVASDITSLYLLEEYFFPIYYSSVILVGITRIIEFIGLAQAKTSHSTPIHSVDDPFMHTMPMRSKNWKWNRLYRRRRREIGKGLQALRM